MRSARGLYRLAIVAAAVGAAAAGLALASAARAIEFKVPSAEAIAAACRSFALPELSVASVVVLALGSLGLATVIGGARALWREWNATRRTLARLPIAASAITGRPDVLVIEDDCPRAFCAGLLRPRIYVSRGAVEMLGEGELRAVLAHEAHHARRRDPLRILLVRVLGEALFFLPLVRRLAARYESLAEVAADEAATREGGGRRSLASALLAFEERAAPGVVGIAPERIDHLLGSRIGWQLPATMVAFGALTVGAVAALSLRTATMAPHADVELPLLLTQLCMLGMALLPVAVGAAGLVGLRRVAAGGR